MALKPQVDPFVISGLSNNGGGGGVPSDPNYLGYYATANDLQTAHPTGQPGQYAIVGETDTFWIWDTDSNSWIDTGNEANPTGFISTADNGLTENPEGNVQLGGQLIQDTVIDTNNFKLTLGNANDVLLPGNIEGYEDDAVVNVGYVKKFHKLNNVKEAKELNVPYGIDNLFTIQLNKYDSTAPQVTYYKSDWSTYQSTTTGKIHAFIYHNGYLWGGTRSKPARLVRIPVDDPNNWDQVTLPDDNEHDLLEDFTIGPNGKILGVTSDITYSNHSWIIEIDTNKSEITWSDWLQLNFSGGDSNTSHFPTIFYLDGYVYVAYGYYTTKIFKIDYKTKQVVAEATLYGRGHAINSDGEYIYVTETANDAHIYKFDKDLNKIAELAFTNVGFTDEFTIYGDYIYIGVDAPNWNQTINIGDTFLKIKKDLSGYEQLNPGDDLKNVEIYEVRYINGFVIASYNTNPATLVYYDPQRNKLYRHTVEGIDVINSLTTDGLYTYFSTWNDGTGTFGRLLNVNLGENEIDLNPVLADNGLTKNGNTIELGGVLNKQTIIDTGATQQLTIGDANTFNGLTVYGGLVGVQGGFVFQGDTFQGTIQDNNGNSIMWGNTNYGSGDLAGLFLGFDGNHGLQFWLSPREIDLKLNNTKISIDDDKMTFYTYNYQDKVLMSAHPTGNVDLAVATVGYVKGEINSVSRTFQNGLTDDGSNVELGGALIKDTIITQNSYELSSIYTNSYSPSANYAYNVTHTISNKEGDSGIKVNIDNQDDTQDQEMYLGINYNNDPEFGIGNSKILLSNKLINNGNNSYIEVSYNSIILSNSKDSNYVNLRLTNSDTIRLETSYGSFSLNNGKISIDGLIAEYSTHPTFIIDTQIVDKKYVDDTVGAAVAPVLKAPDGFSTNSNGDYPTDYMGTGTVKQGDSFVVTDVSNGTTVGTQTVNVGDMLIARVDNPGNDDNNWIIVESNRDQATESVKGVAKIATTAEVDTGANNEDIITPFLLHYALHKEELQEQEDTVLTSDVTAGNVVYTLNNVGANGVSKVQAYYNGLLMQKADYNVDASGNVTLTFDAYNGDKLSFIYYKVN